MIVCRICQKCIVEVAKSWLSAGVSTQYLWKSALKILQTKPNLSESSHSLNSTMAVYLEVNILWNTHQTHHSSEDYTLATALRQSATQTYASVVRKP